MKLIKIDQWQQIKITLNVKTDNRNEILEKAKEVGIRKNIKEIYLLKQGLYKVDFIVSHFDYFVFTEKLKDLAEW